MRRPSLAYPLDLAYPLLLAILAAFIAGAPSNALAAPNAVRFNGSTQYITFGQAPGLNSRTFTIECWFRREGAGGTASTGNGGTVAVPLIAKGRADADANNQDANYFLGIRPTDNVLVADYEEHATPQGTTPGLNHPIAGTTVIQNNVWYHAAATFDGTRWRLFLNGVVEKDTLIGPNRLPRFDSIEHASVGSALTSTGAAGGFFLGQIDEVRIWDHARPEQGIRDSMGLQFNTSSGLLGRWALDEGSGTTAANSVGTINGTLTPTATPPTWVAGGYPGALQFAGTDAYVNFGNPTALKLTAFTLETWFRRDGAGVGANTGTGGIPDLIPLIAKGRAESEDPLLDINYIFGIRAADSVLCADFEEGAAGGSPSQNHPVFGTTHITTGVWHHAAATYDGGIWRLYLDAALEDSLIVNQPLGSASNDSVAIGSALNSTGAAAGFFNGAMDEVRIWNRARTLAEITADINAQIVTARPNLVARWALDGSGTTVRGSASTTINGTLRGSNWSWVPGAPFNFVPPAPPADPTGISATAQSFGSILLQWADNSSNEQNFEITRSTTGPSGTFTPLVTLGANVTSYTDAGLNENTPYCYRVRATNSVGPSNFVAIGCATTPPEGANALVLVGSTPYVSFGNALPLHLDTFTLECWFRRDNAGVGTNTGAGGISNLIPLIARGRAEAESTAVDINYIFGIRASDNVLCADFEEGAAGAAPSQNHPVAGVTPIALGAWHHGAATYDGTSWRLYLDGNLEAELVVGQPPASGSKVAVALGSALNSGGAALGSLGGAMDEARIWSYARTIDQIQSTINGEIRTAQTGLVGRWGLNEGAGSFVNGGAGTGINGSVLGTGFSWASGNAPFNVPPPTAPAAPTGLTATPLAEGQIQLQWADRSNNELTFEIERSPDGSAGSFTPVGTAGVNQILFTDTGLLEVTPYCYRVRASNNIGQSDYTPFKCATTQQSPNRSLDLGGSDAYVTFGDPAALHLPEFTLETWFRREGAGLTASTGASGVVAVPLVTKGVAEADATTQDMNFFLGIRGTDGVLVADFEEGSRGTAPGLNHPVAGVTPILLDTWYHAAATYDGDRWRLYLNGNLERELVVGQPPQSASIQRAALGSALSSLGAPSGAFDGVIDEVRIWNHARTPDEILATINTQLTAAQDGLVARWGLNEGSGTLIRGSAGTAISGTITGDNWSWLATGAPFDVPPPTAPDPPDSLTATTLSYNSIRIDWADHSNNELGFEIERSTSGPGGPFSPLITVGANTESYTDAVAELSPYCYQVRATNTVGPSAYTGIACEATPAEPNQALDLGGTDAYVSFGDPDQLDLSVFTVETWFRRDGAGVSNTTGTGGVDAVPLVTHGTAEVDNQNNLDMNYFLGIRASDGVLCADFEEGADGATPGLNHPIIGTTPIQNGVWYQAAVTYDGNKWQLFLNGNLENELFVGEPPRANTIQPVGLGSGIRSNNVAQGFFDGVLDEARIWDRARSEAEIQADLNVQIKTPRPNLVARWGLNEGSSTIVHGSAGTTLNGNILGANWSWVSGAPFNIAIQHAPAQPTNPFPADEAVQVTQNVNLSVDVADLDSDNLTVTFYGRAVAGAAGPDFTLIGLPDTQFYVSSLNGGVPAIFDSQTNWIVNNMAPTARNIVDVIQLGDCVQNGDNGGNDVEWRNSDHSMKVIENPTTTHLRDGIPFSVCVGNHDQSPIGDAAGTTNFYNQYFGSSRFNGRAYYGGHFGNNNDNHFHLFSASGLDFIVVSFEYDTSPDALVMHWADSLLTAYSNRRAIIASHYIINAGNPATFGAQGQVIYDMAKNHSNVFLMLCGHVSPPEGRRQDTFNGHTIYSILTDYQGRAQGGEGWLRIYEFSPANNVIRARTYSPWLNQSETDADSSSQFTLPYDMGGGVAFTPIATRTVASSPTGTRVTVPWTGLNPAAQYDWYVTVSDGRRTVQGDSWRFTTTDNQAPSVTVTAPNGGESWRSGTHHNITWNATDNNTVDSVYIEYSTNGGSTYPNLIASAIPNSGTFDWVVPATVTTTARVRVTAKDPTGNRGLDVSNANFTITDGELPSVTLNSPVGGEVWNTGSLHNVTWNANDNVGVTAVDLAYSTDGGVSFPNVIATGIANTGSRAWTLPGNLTTAAARVRVIVRDAAGNANRDSSGTNFAIADSIAPTVTLTSPNGGETWGVGTSHNITWTASDNVGVAGVDLSYSTDGGATFPNTIATGASGTSFAWTVPNSVTTTARVRVTARDAAANARSDTSNANFTITPDPTPPTVTVNAPNGGESWASSTHHNITWTASDNTGTVASVDILHSTNGGASYTPVATGIPNTPSSFDWTVPGAVVGSTNRIRVVARDAAGNTARDSSNANFTITDGDRPVVNVTAPDGGERWNIGSTQSITWTATDNVNVTSLDVAFSTSGGSTFTNIVTGRSNTPPSQTWTIPNSPTTNARVRVIARDAIGNMGRDSSALSFTIGDFGAPVVALTSPNGGERWAAGSSHPISWTVSDNVGIAGIDLRYSPDGGATFPTVIATGVSGTSFNWTVPATLNATSRVQITARDAAGNAASDTSNADFAIVPETTPPVVTVTAPNGGESWASSTHHNITWTATDNDTVVSVDILHSTNGGASYTAVATAIPNTSPFDWTVPGAVLGATNRIRVVARDRAGNVAQDSSNANFTITDGTAPALNLTAPDGGELWNIGSSQNITWTATDNASVTSVDLAFSTNGGATFTSIATGLANTGTRAWTIPNSPSINARVRVIARDAVGNAARDSSALAFSIADTSGPAVTLVSPNGTETWGQGSAHNITWTATDNVGVTAIELRYSRDGGATFPTTIATGLSNSGSFAWTVPDTLGSTYRVLAIARDAAGNARSDASNADFSVVVETTPPTVTVNAPNGGESWASGTHHNITWTANDNVGVGSIDILHSTNGGASYTTVVTGIPNTPSSFDWTVPGTVIGTSNRIRVVAHDVNTNTARDSSNANFTITDGEPPTANLTAPDGGETLNIGSTKNVTWSAGDNINVTAIDLALSTNGGATFTNIVTGLSNATPSYAWTVPNSPTANGRVRIIARDGAGNSGRDSSVADFTIVDQDAPQVHVLTPNGGTNWGRGSTQNITWTASDNAAVTGLDLSYSTDNGGSYPNVIANGVSNTGSYPWTLPNNLESSVRVKIVAHDLAGHDATDVSDASFAIVEETVVPSTLERRIAANADDAEERGSTTDLSSSDLELTYDGAPQIVGMRFPGLTIARGARIQRAWVQFKVDEIQSEPTRLVIRAQDSDSAAAFTSASRNISVRPQTADSVVWSPVPWDTLNLIGPKQQTPDLTALVQAVVNRSGWRSGSALAVIIHGTGHRTAKSWDGDHPGAPLLHVEFLTTAGPNQPPRIYAGNDQTIGLGQDLALAPTVNDDGLPTNPGRVTVTWDRLPGPGTVTFLPSATNATSARFSAIGDYQLTATANDGALSAADTMRVTVTNAPPAPFEVRISASSDDAEDRGSSTDLASSDLEMTYDGTTQVVGLRFPGIAIPRGAAIARAWVQFKSRETQSEATRVVLRAEAADSARTFTTAGGSVSSRPQLPDSTVWNPSPWTTVGQADTAQRTPNLAAVIQGVVNRTGWKSGNSLAIIIRGTGHRTARSWDYEPAGAALLHVEITPPAPGLSAAAIERAAGPSPGSSGPMPQLRLAARVVPNPMHAAGVLQLTIGRAGRVRVDLLDVQGRRIGSLLNASRLESGVHRLSLERSGRLGPGVYLYRVVAPEGVVKGRFVIE